MHAGFQSTQGGQSRHTQITTKILRLTLALLRLRRSHPGVDGIKLPSLVESCYRGFSP